MSSTVGGRNDVSLRSCMDSHRQTRLRLRQHGVGAERWGRGRALETVQDPPPDIPGEHEVVWCLSFLTPQVPVSNGPGDLQAPHWTLGLASILYLWQIRTLMPESLINLPEVSSSRARSRIQFSGSKSPVLSTSRVLSTSPVIISGRSEAV